MRLSLTAAPGASQFAPLLLRGPICGAFEVGARLGYDGVELHLRRPEDADDDEIRQLCRRYQLAVPTLGTGMAATQDGLTFSDPDPAVRRGAVGIIRRHIDLAASIASCVTIGLIFGKLGREPASRQHAMERAVSCLSECGAYARERGVILLLEPLNRYESDALNTVADAATIIRRQNIPSTRVLADTFHMNIEERDIAESLNDAGGLLGHIHLADSNRQAPGKGHVDFGRIIEALHHLGYRGFLSFEVLPGTDSLETAQFALAHTRRLLAEDGCPGCAEARRRVPKKPLGV